MSLITCKMCGRLFDAKRGKICTQCMDDLEDLYPKVREYIRDHRNAHFSVDKLAEDMEIDILKVQSLVDLGYLDRDVPGISGVDEERKRKEAIVQQLQTSLSSQASKDDKSKADAKSTKMYGQERYSTGKKR